MGFVNIYRIFFHIGVIIMVSCSYSLSYGQKSITQRSNAPQSPNIVADTVNISGLSQDQVDSINKNLQLLREEIKKNQTSTEDADKRIELINRELSEIRSKNFDSLPADAKKWVEEMTALMETFEKQNSLTQASLKKQMEYREKLSHQIIVKVRNLFVQMFDDIDSRILGLQQQRNWDISYVRNVDFSLFTERKLPIRSEKLYTVRRVSFKNGSSIEIVLISGTLHQGIIEDCPKLQFFEVIDQKRTLAFSIGQGASGGTMILGGPPLIPDLIKPRLEDLSFDPKGENLFNENFKKKFLGNFTQFIGSAFSRDAESGPR